ncbi:hypothetical protein [Dyella sp. 2HG41-7]|uniref:hypothetical protein n=1 Tax=Dyella sp. 2HG41-7 TaxID=2883239 RepID=UPI001F2C9CF7|nr:hypothetical protein [Dyella sp. 2HG41-7]
MIELEVQGLSHSREGLLVDVGRSIIGLGFSLVKQRLADDANGVLLTLVVRGLAQKQRTLEAMLETHPRIVSFDIAPYVQGQSRPHFAASRSMSSGYVPPPAPPPQVMPKIEPAPAPSTVSQASTPKVSTLPAETSEQAIDPIPAAVERRSAEPEMAPPPPPIVAKQEPDIVLVRPPAPSRAPSAPSKPFVDVAPLDADTQAVEDMLPVLTSSYPQIFPHVKKLERSVAEGARESTLQLAGQRIGTWAFERNHANDGTMNVAEALDRIGVPALSALVEMDRKGNQLYIRHSPLCTEEGRSSCKFFSGYLEGLLGPLLPSKNLSIFEVGCRSCGANECVLAIMD